MEILIGFFVGIGVCWLVTSSNGDNLKEALRKLATAEAELANAQAELSSTKEDLADARDRLRQRLHKSWNTGPKPNRAIFDPKTDNAHMLNNWD